MHRSFICQLIITSLFLCLPVSAIAQPGNPDTGFIHPGLLQNREDILRLKNAVAAKHPVIYEGYLVFEKSPYSQYDYQVKGPLPEVGRNPGVGNTAYDSDANAAYQNAIMWAVTADERYARKAVEIIDSWTNTLQKVTGRDAVLMAGLGPFKMVNAAEIMRYTYPAWTEAAAKRTEQHFLKVIYPVVAEFAPFANGNWDGAALKTVMAIGIYCNNRGIFERAIRYYVNGWGNGSLTNYIINDQGQVQETGRDQAHSQLGIGMLAECSEMAWHQGLDLYSYAGNRLLKGFEYTARYNLGDNGIPYTPAIDRTGKYLHQRPSEIARGNLRAVYEQVYNHYVKRMGLNAPYIARAAEKLRPEGPGNPGADHPGYGTLLYTIDSPAAQQVPAPITTLSPAGLQLEAKPGNNLLSWVRMRGATAYKVKRAEKREGPFVTIGVAEENIFSDSGVKNGKLYYYTVTGTGNNGESLPSFPVSGYGGGLPRNWHNIDIGSVNKPGYALAGEDIFRIEAGGMLKDSLPPAFNYTYRKLKKNDEMIMELYPQPSSQFTAVGLMVRADLREASPFLALLIRPVVAKELEAPNWFAELSQGSGAGTSAIISRQPLAAPAVTNGRLTGRYWIKITRKGNLLTGWGSDDGHSWRQLGESRWTTGASLLLGIAAASNIANTTTVRVAVK